MTVRLILRFCTVKSISFCRLAVGNGFMMSSPVFKISASLVKPTRESLLDYCSYCLVIVSLIGLTRVWIGGAGLRNGCPTAYFENPGEEIPRFGENENEINPKDTTERAYSGDIMLELERKPGVTSAYKSVGHNDFYITQPVIRLVLDSVSGEEGVAIQERIVGKSGNHKYSSENLTKTTQLDDCAKQHQTVFAYILLIESLLLLLFGLIWAKVPNVSHVVKEFGKLIRACEKSDWAKNALNIITDKRQIDNVSQSLYSIISSESAACDIKSLLDTLFRPDGDYKAKSSARHLYEKVQIFCNTHSHRTAIWKTYISKSFLQFILWIIIFNINLVLFVVLEFYIMCPEDSPTPCDHDTFLRIIWFLAQTVLLIYVVFNCKTLKWINEKSIVHSWSCCNYVNCFKKHRTLFANDDEKPLITCRPYRFADNEPVYNDVALLLHLLAEAHPKVLPYILVFMCPEWKAKLTSFANPVLSVDIPIRSQMQMLSGRSPPIIEITDIPSLSDEEQQTEANVTSTTLCNKKSKGTVTFYIGKETKNNNHPKVRKPSSGGPSSTDDAPTLSPPHRNHQKTCPKEKRWTANSAKISQDKTGLFVDLTNAPSDSGCGLTGDDSDETTALIHKNTFSDSNKDSDHDSSDTNAESNQSSDVSESCKLLEKL